MELVAWLQALQVVVTVGGFGFAIWQLRSEYRWRRREFALHMLAEWNDKTAAHHRGIEAGLPGLLDASPTDASSELTPARAEAVYLARRGDPDWDLRTHIVELLNYSEYVAVAYVKRVGDREIMADSLCRTVARWYRRLEPYVAVTGGHRGFDPWRSLSAAAQELERAAESSAGKRPRLAR